MTRVKWQDDLFKRSPVLRSVRSQDDQITALLTPDNECELWITGVSQIDLCTTYGKIMRGSLGIWQRLLGARLTLVDEWGEPVPEETEEWPKEGDPVTIRGKLVGKVSGVFRDGERVNVSVRRTEDGRIAGVRVDFVGEDDE